MGGEEGTVLRTDVAEWKIDESIFQNWGMPQPILQVHDSDGFSSWILYRELGISRQSAWYQQLHVVHWRHFWVHFAALLQYLHGNLGL